MQNVIVVGVGEYYTDIVGPSLQLLEQEGVLKVICLVDVIELSKKAKNFFSKAEFRKRQDNQPLSELLKDLRNSETIVLLGHVNNLHASDAKDLTENGFKVMLEKPYFLNNSQSKIVKNIIGSNDLNQLILLEYYIQMKTIPLLILAGKIKKDSFYLTKPNLLQTEEGMLVYAKSVNDLVGQLKKIIGKPQKVVVELLEGEGKTGRLDHRGAYLSDIKIGGGVILDLGIHAFAPLFILEDYLGEIDVSFLGGFVRAAKCKEHIEMCKEKFLLPENEVAETCAEIKMNTKIGIPINVIVGKYVLPDKNRRQIVIYGDKNMVKMDLSNCSLSIINNGKEEKILTFPKKSDSKYYSVVRSGLEISKNNSPFTFNLKQKALKVQSFVLNVRHLAYQTKINEFFLAGIEPIEIFK